MKLKSILFIVFILAANAKTANAEATNFENQFREMLPGTYLKYGSRERSEYSTVSMEKMLSLIDLNGNKAGCDRNQAQCEEWRQICMPMAQAIASELQRYLAFAKTSNADAALR